MAVPLSSQLMTPGALSSASYCGGQTVKSLLHQAGLRAVQETCCLCLQPMLYLCILITHVTIMHSLDMFAISLCM
jgi:hypothetical protein